MKEVFDDQVLEDWGVKDWRAVFRSTGDDAEFMQVGGGRDSIPIALIKEILKYAPQGAKFIQKGWQKAVQAYKGEIVKGLKIDQNTLNKIPKELGDAKIARDGIGLRYGDKSNSIRIMKGKPDAQHPSQRVDYVKITSNGKVVDKNGVEIAGETLGVKTRENPDVHIPFSEWKNWTGWNRP